MTNVSNREKRYDYIVVGAGAAGSVLAAELSASGAQVLVVESGGPDDAPTIANPSIWFYNVGGPLDYHLPITPSPQLNHRNLNLPLGHVLGGGSSINAMVWMRGMQRDYDGWAENGAKGWAFADVLPVFKKQEDWEGGANEWRGSGGPIHVRRPKDPHPTAPAFIEAARQMGMPILDDVNGPVRPGAGYINMNIAADGTRVSAVRAFLRPALSRPNLTLLLNTNVVKLNFKGTRCVGVKLMTDGAVRDIAADKEVILATGAIHSPKLLMLSGVGEAKALRSLGIDAVENLPGVGQNLQDHVLLSGVVFKYKGKMPDRPADSNAVEAEAYLASGPSGDTDISLVLHQLPAVTPEVASRFGTPPPDAFTIAPALVQPTSKGSVRLASDNFQDAAVIDGNYLGTDHDFAAIVSGIEAARELGNQHGFDNLRESEIIPGPKAKTEDIRELARLASASFGHAVGTCKIGMDNDKFGCRPRTSRPRNFGLARGGRLRDATNHYGAGDKRVRPHDRGPRSPADSRLKKRYRMTGNPDTSLTIDTHHHILPDPFWQEKARAFEETHHFAEHFAASILARCSLIVGLCLFVTSVVNAQTPDPSPLDAPQPGVRPALGPFPRFEDWSFLRDPSQRIDPFDRLKFIPLNESGTTYLTLSVENRTEFQYLKNNAWGAGAQDLTGYVFERFMPSADLHLGDHARIFVTLAFDEVGDKKAGPRPLIDKDVADGHEGFVEFGGNLYDRHPGWDVIVGRQEVLLGTGRLFDDNEGVNVRSAFDGVRIGYDKPKGRIDLIAVKPVETNPGAWDDIPNPAITLWGLYASNVRWNSQFMSDVYFLDYDAKLATYQNQSAREQRRTIGARYFNRPPNEPPTAGFDYNVETGFQWGSFGNRSIRAWGAGGNIGWTLPGPVWRARFGFQVDALSGDNGGPATLGTLNAMFPRGAYFGPKFAFIGPANLLDLQPQFVFHPLQNVTGTFEWIWFWRESTKDALYTFGNVPLRPANPSSARYVGSQPNLEIRWAITEHFLAALNVAGFITGTFLQQSPPSKEIVFFNAGLTYRF